MTHYRPETFFELLLCKTLEQKFWLPKQLHVIGAQFPCVKVHPDLIERWVEFTLFAKSVWLKN